MALTYEVTLGEDFREVCMWVAEIAAMTNEVTSFTFNNVELHVRPDTSQQPYWYEQLYEQYCAGLKNEDAMWKAREKKRLFEDH